LLVPRRSSRAKRALRAFSSALRRAAAWSIRKARAALEPLGVHWLKHEAFLLAPAPLSKKRA